MHRVCIAGRPNVGKSTLFNRLVRRRLAITDGRPGVTRDTLERHVELAGRRLVLVDTGGIGESEEVLDQAVFERSRRAIDAADLVVLVVDVNGLTGEDEELIDLVRRSGRPAILCINKVDNAERDRLVDEFWSVGFARIVAISAAHGHGIDELIEQIEESLAVTDPLPSAEEEAEEPVEVEGDELENPEQRPIRLAIVGRPNTGKSSILNTLTGEERSIVSDLAGTTRDTVEASFEFGGATFEIVDTAGIRRRSRVNEPVEYYAVTRAEEAIRRCDVAILVVDATQGLEDQDKKIASRITEYGRGVVVVLNKWDLLDNVGNLLQAMTDRIRYQFPVFSHVPVLPVSARTGEGFDAVMRRVVDIDRQLRTRIDTGRLNKALKGWIEQTPPPSGKRPIKVRYMTQVSVHPLRFVAFVNRSRGFPEFYQRYLINRIREDLGFHHVSIALELREQR